MPMLLSKAMFSAGTLRSCSARMALAAMVGRIDFRSSSRGFGFFMNGLFLIEFEDAFSMWSVFWRRNARYEGNIALSMVHQGLIFFISSSNCISCCSLSSPNWARILS
ncbi:hypothetical protein D3C78_1624760 [compost metagenome]